MLLLKWKLSHSNKNYQEIRQDMANAPKLKEYVERLKKATENGEILFRTSGEEDGSFVSTTIWVSLEAQLNFKQISDSSPETQEYYNYFKNLGYTISATKEEI